MYKIYYHYTTGNTFESGPPDGCHDHVFSNLDDAKAALQRMKEHHDWRCSVDSHWKDNEPQPKWWKPYEGRFKDSYCWYFPVMFDGEEVWLSPSTYQGYFQTLHSAEIKHVTPKENGMRFEVC